ncbi:MAG: hypothetical protein ACRDQZ_01750 [Mycobacteriales bacterium]
MQRVIALRWLPLRLSQRGAPGQAGSQVEPAAPPGGDLGDRAPQGPKPITLGFAEFPALRGIAHPPEKSRAVPNPPRNGNRDH